MVSLFVQVDVGLHVPDELVGQQLGGLGGPQDVLPHVAHLGTHSVQKKDSVGGTGGRHGVWGRVCRMKPKSLPCHSGGPGRFEECKTEWRPNGEGEMVDVRGNNTGLSGNVHHGVDCLCACVCVLSTWMVPNPFLGLCQIKPQLANVNEW